MIQSVGVWTAPDGQKQFFHPPPLRRQNLYSHSHFRRLANRIRFIRDRWGTTGFYLIEPLESERQSEMRWLLGPTIPATLEPNNAINWRMDAPMLIAARGAATLPTRVNAYVDLSTGHRIWTVIHIDEWVFDRAWAVLEARYRKNSDQWLPPWPKHRPGEHGTTREIPSPDIAAHLHRRKHPELEPNAEEIHET